MRGNFVLKKYVILLIEFAILLLTSEQYAIGSEKDDDIQFSIKGFLDTYHAVGVDRKGKMMSSRTRARGELKAEKGMASMFVSLNAVQNSVVKDYTGIQLREAFFSYANGNYDFTIGRQIVVWGIADALRLTDCVSPFDYSEFLARDYDDIRIPVNALRLKYIGNNTTVELLCIPLSDFFIMPINEENPWSVHISENVLREVSKNFSPGNQSLPMPYSWDLEVGKPVKKIKNLEYGTRITGYLNALDYSFAFLRTWNKMPVIDFEGVDNQLIAKGRYERMTMLGADCSASVGQFVIRAEVAAYLGNARMLTSYSSKKKQNTFNSLIGVDWYPGGDWNISAQYCHRYESIDGNGGLATFRLSKKLLRSTLDLSSFAYIDVQNGGIFNRFSASYALNDQISLMTGYDLFHAQKGMFSMYKDNSEMWLKVKYSF